MLSTQRIAIQYQRAAKMKRTPTQRIGNQKPATTLANVNRSDSHTNASAERRLDKPQGPR
jgi:hypothetical protein